MSVQKLIYGEFVTDSLITALTNDSRAAISLIRELNHHYGLQVIDHKHEYQVVGAELNVPTFYLVDKNGFAQGHVYSWEEDSKTHYAYYTPHSTKERGKSDKHRNTWTSHKLSSLMGALKKTTAIKPDTTVTKLRRAVDGLRNQVEQSFGRNYKGTDPFTGDDIHQMLEVILNGAPLFIDRSKCQTALDKYNEIDSNIVEKNKEVTRMFEMPFYLIAADKRGHCMVGKIKRIRDSSDPYRNEIVQSFKRVTQETLYRDYTDLIPILTMSKVAYEGTGHTMITPFMPRADMYNADLDVAFYYPTNVSEYHEQWMMIPAGS
jgi:hypothetical protein